MKTTRTFDYNLSIKNRMKLTLDTFEAHNFDKTDGVEIIRVIFTGNQAKDPVIVRLKGQRTRKNGQTETLTERELVFQLAQLADETIVPALTLSTLVALGDLRPKYAKKTLDACLETIKECLRMFQDPIAQTGEKNRILKLCAAREHAANALAKLDAQLSPEPSKTFCDSNIARSMSTGQRLTPCANIPTGTNRYCDDCIARRSK
jgi:hypothetical protein